MFSFSGFLISLVIYIHLYTYIDYMSFDLKIEECCGKPITCRRSSERSTEWIAKAIEISSLSRAKLAPIEVAL